jgi:hypothetical protein
MRSHLKKGHETFEGGYSRVLKLEEALDRTGQFIKRIADELHQMEEEFAQLQDRRGLTDNALWERFRDLVPGKRNEVIKVVRDTLDQDLIRITDRIESLNIRLPYYTRLFSFLEFNCTYLILGSEDYKEHEEEYVHVAVKRKVQRLQTKYAQEGTESLLHRLADEEGKTFEAVKRAYYYKGKKAPSALKPERDHVAERRHKQNEGL